MLNPFILGMSVFYVLSLIHLRTPIYLVPSSVDTLGYPQLSWVVYMGILPLVPHPHLFSIITFPFHSFIQLLLFPDTFWFVSLLPWLLCHWFLCMPLLCYLSCDTNSTVIGPKIIPNVCVVPFSNILGVRKIIPMLFYGYKEVLPSSSVSVICYFPGPFVLVVPWIILL